MERNKLYQTISTMVASNAWLGRSANAADILRVPNNVSK